MIGPAALTERGYNPYRMESVLRAGGGLGSSSQRAKQFVADRICGLGEASCADMRADQFGGGTSHHAKDPRHVHHELIHADAAYDRSALTVQPNPAAVAQGARITISVAGADDGDARATFRLEGAIITDSSSC